MRNLKNFKISFGLGRGLRRAGRPNFGPGGCPRPLSNEISRLGRISPLTIIGGQWVEVGVNLLPSAVVQRLAIALAALGIAPSIGALFGRWAHLLSMATLLAGANVTAHQRDRAMKSARDAADAVRLAGVAGTMATESLPKR